MADIINLLELEVNIPTDNFGEYCTSLAAPPKWGKTEWAIKYDKPFILDFEEGSKGKVVRRVKVSKWSEVKKYVRQLVSEPKLKENIQTVVFDTVNYGLKALKKWVVSEYQSKYPEKLIDTFNKIPYGHGWDMLIDEFTSEVNKLKHAGYGVVLISHVKTKEYEKETESAHYKTVPDLTDKERNMITAMADFMLLGEFETETIVPAKLNNDGRIVEEAVTETKRVIYLRTSNHAEAGFRWVDCPDKIPANYELFQKIFKEALLKEVERGKEKYGLTDEKTEKIRKDLDEIKQQEQEESIKQEQGLEVLKKIIEDIKNKAKELQSNGVVVKVINKILNGNPDKLTSIDEANKILKGLNELEVSKE